MLQGNVQPPGTLFEFTTGGKLSFRVRGCYHNASKLKIRACQSTCHVNMLFIKLDNFVSVVAVTAVSAETSSLDSKCCRCVAILKIIENQAIGRVTILSFAEIFP